MKKSNGNGYKEEHLQFRIDPVSELTGALLTSLDKGAEGGAPSHVSRLRG